MGRADGKPSVCVRETDCHVSHVSVILRLADGYNGQYLKHVLSAGHVQFPRASREIRARHIIFRVRAERFALGTLYSVCEQRDSRSRIILM